MIGHGRYKDAFLYEVTSQDLLSTDNLKHSYQAGTVLMFADKRSISLGTEFARADDLAAAKAALKGVEIPPAQDSPREPAQDSPREPAQDSPREPAQDSPTQDLPAQDSPREPAEDSPAQDSPREPIPTPNKQIRILHEFPTAQPQSLSLKTCRALRTAVKAVALALLALILLGMGSICATAQANGISYGAALDVLVDGLGF